jgi:CheY-like chemotaxis protein
MSNLANSLPLPLLDLRVLLVDDSVDNQFLIKRILVKNGALVDVAGNGREAVTAALAKAYEIVLMDIQMPELDGYQAAAILFVQGYQTPILALTAHAMAEDRAKSRAAGFAGHLTKPIDTKELIEMISSKARITGRASATL